ncbi:MAG: glutaredoxin family protein [Chloroflexi bacterium]|nr:glutaredoxin family protein [Chloroflexota bacterium]
MCRKTKELLSAHQVAFTEVNVLTHPRALLKLMIEFKKFAPAVVVGKEAISGFNHRRLKQALGLAKN